MKRNTARIVLVLLLLSSFSKTTVESATRLYYLGTLPGGGSAVPYAINNSGIVGGAGFPASGNYAAILFDVLHGGSNINLNQSGGWSAVRGISNTGQIVGMEAKDPMLEGRALLFDASGNGNNINLGTGKRAYAINNVNQVVGGSGDGGLSTTAWLWDDLGSGTDAISLGQGEATAISDNGIIVGNSHFGGTSFEWRATLYDPSGAENNVNLGKLLNTDERSFAHDVNDVGQVVGISGSPAVGYTATLFDISGGGQNIAIGSIGYSYARAINSSGIVVGDEDGHAAVFDVSGNQNNIDLNDLIDPSSGWVLQYATGINDLGWIIGVGNYGAFLLAPDDAFPNYVEPPLPPGPTVPEPCSLLLVLAGICCSCLRSR